MTAGQRLVSAGLMVILLLLLGAGGGVWLASRHYRPVLDIANTDLANARSARDNLETLAGEQGRKLSELVQASNLRERTVAMAQATAIQQAQPDFFAANQLLRERTGGDSAQTAAAIIDRELGL